jgi:hypothetical protein
LRLSRLQRAMTHFLADLRRIWRRREAVYERVDVPPDILELALEIIDLRLELTEGL